MKKIIFLLFFGFLFNLNAQVVTPTGINYQAVIKNSSGQVYKNTNLNVRFSLAANTSGIYMYQETHTTTTTNDGQIALIVGTGVTSSSQSPFSFFPWEYVDPIYLKTEVSVAGASYVNLGMQILNYVPKAYYSRVSSKTFDLKIRGNNNITVGTQIPPQSNVSNTVAIGSGVVVSESNTIRLGNDSTQFIETTGAISTTNRILVNTGDVSANVTPYGQIRAYRNDYHAAALVANSGIVTSTGGMYTSGSVQAGNGVANIAVLNGTSGIVSSTGGMYTSGTVTATKFVGDGSLLSNLPSSANNNRIWISHREFGDNTQDISRYMGSFNGYSYEFLNLEKGSSGISQTRAYFLPPSHWGNGNYKITMYFLTPNANTGNIQVSGGVITTTLSGTASTTGSKIQVISSGSDFSGNSHGGFQYGGAAGFPGPLSAAANVGTNSSFSRPLQKVTYTYNYNFSNIDFAVFYLSRYLNTGYSYSDTYNGDFYVVGIKIEKNY